MAVVGWRDVGDADDTRRELNADSDRSFIACWFVDSGMSTARETLPTVDVPRYGAVAVAAWVAAVLLYGFGDTGTTIVSLELGGLEASPVPRMFLEALGYAGLVLNKALVIGLCWLVWRFYPSVGGIGPDPFRLAVPALLAARGVWLVVHNAGVIATLLG